MANCAPTSSRSSADADSAPQFTESELDYDDMTVQPVSSPAVIAIDVPDTRLWQPLVMSDLINDSSTSFLDSYDPTDSLLSLHGSTDSNMGCFHTTDQAMDLEFLSPSVCSTASSSPSDEKQAFGGSFSSSSTNAQDEHHAPWIQTPHTIMSSSSIPITDSKWPIVSPSQTTASPASEHSERSLSSTTPQAAFDNPATNPTRRRGRQPHSLVERRYRENLNSQIEELQHALQKVQVNRTGDRQHSAEIISLDTTVRIRKSDILAKALNYVYQSEVDMRHMANEISRLQGQVEANENMEALGKCKDCPWKKKIMEACLENE